LQFLEFNEIREWFDERGFPLDAAGTLRQDPSYVRVLRVTMSDVVPAATECSRRLGVWDECLLWITLWGVWPSSEDWPKYYQWRGMHGERRSLDVAPGHLFKRSDFAGFEELLGIVIENGWEGHVLPIAGLLPSTSRAFVSHDEWIDVFSKTTSALAGN